MNKPLKSLLTLSLLTLTTASFAQNNDDKFFAGVGVGQATTDACDQIALPCDDTSSAWKGVIGYNFHKNFGLEFSYNNIGKTHAYDTPNELSASLDVDAYALAAVGRIDITESFGLYGKVGATSWEADLRLREEDLRTDYEDDGSDITYGIGATWTFDKDYHLSVEWQRYDIEFDNISGLYGDDSSSDVISVLYTVSF
jgi:hypothetical protein